jgi:PAS domain S-box-containing protein
LRAIQDGEVDALVMRGPASDQVFTIEGDTESYRTFMESMEPGAAALDDAGRLLYANTPLLSLLQTSLESIQGRRFVDTVQPSVASDIAGLISSADSAKHSGNVRFSRPGKEDRHFIASATPLRIGTVLGHALTFTDVTERVRTEAAEQSERAARAVIASANEAVLVCDRDGIITHANGASHIVYEGDPVGQLFAEAVPLVFPGATGIMRSEDVVAMAIAGNPMQGMEAVAPNAPRIKNYLISAAPLQVAEDQVSGCVITMIDLTQRKEAEQRQLLLMGELDHRVKNTLALVLSISSRTLSNEDTLEGFQKAFTGRIQALAATHTLLADRSWTDLRLSDIIGAEVAPYVSDETNRVTIEDLDIAVTPRAAIALGLVVHELTTNAVKYGALAGDEGIVTVRAQDRTDGEPLVIEWRETGGPEVAPPKRQGFGRTVISRSLQYSPQGGATLDFQPTGLVCRISLPAEDLH